jgi:uncharacterized cupin superfamily protein
VAEYSHLNLKDDVKNAAEEFGLAPDLETRFGRNALGLEGGGFSYQKMAPNLESGFGHRHERQEEAYVVIAGSGRVKLEDEVRELKQWDVLRVAPTVGRAFAAGPDGLELLAIGFGPGGDATLIEKPWAD